LTLRTACVLSLAVGQASDLLGDSTNDAASSNGEWEVATISGRDANLLGVPRTLHLYIMRRAGFPLAPLIIGMILGSVMKSNFRRALLLSDDGLMIFIERPISATIIIIDLLLLISIVASTVRMSQQKEPDAALDSGG
jgi:hypothetical protein